MSDVNGLVVTDVLGLAKPLQKLIETAAIGVGKVYEPTHIRRMAKAKADEIQIISKSINKNIALPIHYEDGSVCIAAEDANELVRRAQNRALYQEMKKQQNIESVIGKAYDELSTVSDVSDTPVDSDWVSEFFDNVANVSNDGMQTFWAKLLAGEVLKPGSFSLRTLATLKNLSQEEAALFTQITPYVLQYKQTDEEGERSLFLFSKFDLLQNNGISFGSILWLSEAGLINDSGNAMINILIKPGQNSLIEVNNKVLNIKNTRASEVSLGYEVYPLTEAGTELFPVAVACQSEITNTDNYVGECLELLRGRGFGSLYRESVPQDVLMCID